MRLKGGRDSVVHSRRYSLSLSYQEIEILEDILLEWRQKVPIVAVASRNATDDLAKRLTSMRAIAGLLEKP